MGSTTGGAGAGKLKLQDFNLTKRIDPLSLELTRATAALTRFPEAVVSVPIGGSLSPFAIEYRLRQVYVQSVQQSGSGDQSTESVSLVYGSFDQARDGGSPEEMTHLRSLSGGRRPVGAQSFGRHYVRRPARAKGRSCR